MSLPQLYKLNTGSDLIASTLYLRDLTKDSTIYVPLPPDDMYDLTYPTTYHNKCSICNSPWRERAEHVYIQGRQRPQSVVNFFEEHFRAKVTHEAVSTHMKNHCTFKGLSIGGINDYIDREGSVAKIKFRENDFILTALLVELDDIRAIDCNKNNELKFKQAAMVNQITDRIANVKQRRDEAAKGSINIFETLLEIYNDLTCSDCKVVLQEKVKQIRQKLIDEAG